MLHLPDVLLLKQGMGGRAARSASHAPLGSSAPSGAAAAAGVRTRGRARTWLHARLCLRDDLTATFGKNLGKAYGTDGGDGEAPRNWNERAELEHARFLQAIKSAPEPDLQASESEIKLVEAATGKRTPSDGELKRPAPDQLAAWEAAGGTPPLPGTTTTPWGPVPMGMAWPPAWQAQHLAQQQAFAAYMLQQQMVMQQQQLDSVSSSRVIVVNQSATAHPPTMPVPAPWLAPLGPMSAAYMPNCPPGQVVPGMPPPPYGPGVPGAVPGAYGPPAGPSGIQPAPGSGVAPNFRQHPQGVQVQPSLKQPQ